MGEAKKALNQRFNRSLTSPNRLLRFYPKGRSWWIMGFMKRLGLVLFLISMGVVFAWARWADYKANRDWKTVEQLLGYPGQAEGDGFKITVPRYDLNVLVHGSLLDSQAGLASWFAFKPLARGSFLSGDLVVTDAEVPRVEAQLASSQMTLTAFYRPFNGETPGVERISFMGQGTRVLLAQDVRALLAATMMPLAASSLKTAQPSSAQTAWGMPLEKSLGPGRWIGGTLSFSFVPAEPVTEENIELPSYIGLETTVHFQPEGKQAKAYGEWVLTQAEAQKVIGSLMENHIDITGIHSTLIPQTPAMVYIDFWAEGDAPKLAKSFKEALKQTKLIGWTPGAQSETKEP
jgi:hypothetical protein